MVRCGSVRTTKKRASPSTLLNAATITAVIRIGRKLLSASTVATRTPAMTTGALCRAIG